MKQDDPTTDSLRPLTRALCAPAFTQEKTYLTIIGQSLEIINAVKARQAWAKQQPFNPATQPYAIKPSSLIDAAVLKTLGQGGSLVDEES